MKKTFIIWVVVAVVIIFILVAYGLSFTKKNIVGADSPKNATYVINGKSVTLKNGYSQTEFSPGSATKITTQYFGNEVKHDFNGDGREDVAFLLTQNPGGSGTFYYIVAALNTPSGYVGSQAFLLGDRIAPQTTEMSQDKTTSDVVVVNYADRKLGESFSTPPSIGKSIWLKFDSKTMQFGEVVQNFEGEADSVKMTLGMKTWNWINTIYNNDTAVSPKVAGKFTIAFKDDKTFSAKTDCNGVGGEYAVSGNKITFTKMMSTLMFCEGSQEQDYSKMLGQVQNYLFTSKGELVLGLKMDSGSMVFK